MNWDVIGAIGEVVGALAVLITLVYLAIQVRQARKELHTTGFQQVNTLLNETSSSITAETARALAKIKNHQPLEDWEKILSDEYFFRLATSLEIAWVLTLSGSMEVTESEVRSTIAAYMDRPGFQGWWSEHRDEFFGAWREVVDDSLIRNSA